MDEKTPFYARERARFPLTERYAYLDHSGRGPLSPPAAAMIERVAHDLRHVHPDQAKEMHAQFHEARKAMADLIGAKVSSIGLIPNTSTGIALAAGSLEIGEGDNVICAREEFPANVYPWLNLERKGVKIRFLDRPRGGPTVDQIRAVADARTRALALSWVGFCDGARIDTAAIGAFCAEQKIAFILDAIQGVGALKACPDDVDFLVCGSGKWTLAPQGGGFVHIRPERIAGLMPDRVGWLSMASSADLKQFHSLTDYVFELAHDARRVETGSNSLLTQLPLGASCRYLVDMGPETVEKRILYLCDYLIEGLAGKGLSTAAPTEGKLRSGIVAFPVPDAVDLAKRLLERDVIVSAREGRIRVGIHFYNNEEDLDRLLEIL